MSFKISSSAAARLNNNWPIALVLMIGLASLLTAGPGLYAIGSWFLHPFDQWEEAFNKELSSGVVALRITSVVLMLRLIVDLLPARIIQRLIGMFVRMFVGHTNAANPMQVLQTLPEHRSVFAIKITHYSQVLYFNLALLVMWWMQIQGHASGPAYKLLSLVLLFIVDDWAIIAAWMRESKGRIIKMHQVLVLGCNILILLLIAAVTIPHLHDMAVIPLGPGLFLLKWRYAAAFFLGEKSEDEVNEEILKGDNYQI